MSVEGVFIGDLHLDGLRKLFPDNHLDLQMAEFRKPLRYAVELGLNFVILGGDISHNTRLSYEAQMAFLEVLHEYDGTLDIHVILGNHDVRNKDLHSLQPLVQLCRMEKFRTIYIYDRPNRIQLDGTVINFLPFPYDCPPFSLGPTVNIGHLETTGARRDNGQRITKGWRPTRDQDIWLMGHLHLKQKTGNVWYPGTLYQMNFGEPLPKGWMHFILDTRNNQIDADITWIQNEPAFRLVNLSIEVEADLDKIESNPLHRYKLWLKSGVVLPPGFLTAHPNVYNVVGYKHRQELLSLEDTAVDGPQWDLLTGLDVFLKDKGATRSQIRRGQQLIESFLKDAA